MKFKEIFTTAPTLASNLYKTAKQKKVRLTWGEALSWAFFVLKNELQDTAYMVIRFVKKSGEATKRVVTRNWAKFNTPKGGRPAPAGLNIFADLSKVAFNIIAGTRQSSVISCYTFEKV